MKGALEQGSSSDIQQNQSKMTRTSISITQLQDSTIMREKEIFVLNFFTTKTK